MLNASLVLSFLGMTCLAAMQAPDTALLLKPDYPEMNRRAPEVCRILLDTSKSRILVEMTRAWSPHGADRFDNLVRHGYLHQAGIDRPLRSPS